MGYKPTKKYPQETEIVDEVKGADELLKYAEKMVKDNQKKKTIHPKRNANDILRHSMYQLPLSDTP